MKLKYLLICIFAMSLAAACGKENPDEKQEEETADVFNDATDKITDPQTEFRGVWLTTASRLDWPSTAYTSEEQKSLLVGRISAIKNLNCNVVIFQVASAPGAMYKSSLLPWSKTLTGTQGVDPGYDPLQLAVETCHSLGMEIHAWLNPFMFGSASTTRSSTHPAVLHPDWTLTYDSSLYWNPGCPEVQQFLYDEVHELVTNYDIDGVHIDDFFYPDGLQSDAKEWNDSVQYQKYGNGKTLAQWRYDNVDKVVELMHKAVHDVRPGAVFGVSPQGKMENTLPLYANPEDWVAQGTIDYLAPQIYWYHGHRTADFTTVLNDWVEKRTKSVPLIPGLAAYRYGETGFTSLSEFKDQVNECRTKSIVKGNIWFRTEHVTASEFRSYLKQEIYPYLALAPQLATDEVAVSLNTPAVSVSGTKISWNVIEGADNYGVFLLKKSSGSKTEWTPNLVYYGPKTEFTAENGSNYAVIACKGHSRSKMAPPVHIN